MPFPVGSNFAHHANDPHADIVRRCYINSIDYTQYVSRWPSVSRDWNSIRAANVSIELSNTNRLFNFFTSDKTRLRDAVDVDYGLKYRSHNNLTWSHVLSATDWDKQRSNILDNQIANPIDGEVDVDKLFDDTSVNTSHRMLQKFDRRIVFEDADYWATFYAKPDESRAAHLRVVNGGQFFLAFDVESGTTIGTIDARFTDYFVRQSTNGFYFCGAKFTSQTSDEMNYGISLADPSDKSVRLYTGTGSDGLYLYGLQLQEAQYSESHRYFMTDASRQEPQGMNIGHYSEVFSSDSWNKSDSVFITLNSSIAPDGSATANHLQNSHDSTTGNIRQNYSLTEAEKAAHDYYCASIYVKGADGNSRLRFTMSDQSGVSETIIGHHVIYDWDTSSLSTNNQYRVSVNSGMSWISNGGADVLNDGWVRLWCAVRNPIKFIHDDQYTYDLTQSYLFPSISPSSGSALAWGYDLQKGGRELLEGPGPYVAVHSTGVIYPSNGEEVINLFDGTIIDANYSRGRLKLSAKDKLRNLSERIVGTGEVSVAVDSITPSWLMFTLCSCYGGMSNVQSTSNPDIDWAAVDSWDSYNASNAVHIKTDLRGMKVTEALRRLSRMTRTAIFLEQDRVTVRRWTTVESNVLALGNADILSTDLSVNDQDMVNKQWVFADWDQASEYYQIATFDEDTTSQSSYGLREKVIRDKALFYVTSAAALDTAQRIVLNESEPIDRIGVKSIIGALRMQIGESISINDPELQVDGTYRIMGSRIDMDKDVIGFDVDNSQLILGNPFTLDTSSLGGTDILS